VALASEEPFAPLIGRIVGSMDEQHPTTQKIELVDLSKPHELQLHTTAAGAVIFDINDPQVNAFGVQSIVHTAPVSDDGRLFLILSRAADFYHHFRRSNKQSLLAQHVSLKAYSLSRQSKAGEDVWFPTDVGNNLNVNGLMAVEVTAEQAVYGFSLTNNTKDPLYVWAFFFELADLSIREFSFYTSMC
jgi:hypothetical protein